MARPKNDLVNFKNKLKEIRDRAKEMEPEQQAFFLSTLERYEMQVEIVESLQLAVKKALSKGNMTIENRYGGEKTATRLNPVINGYQQAVLNANKTVETLVKIVKGLGEIKKEKPDDPLLDILNGTVE